MRKDLGKRCGNARCAVHLATGSAATGPAGSWSTAPLLRSAQKHRSPKRALPSKRRVVRRMRRGKEPLVGLHCCRQEA